MAKLKIAHLSDLHVLQDYHGAMTDREPLRQPIQPVNYFVTGLREAVASQPDVIVLTGDLVHEGTVEDYVYLRGLLEKNCAGIPVIPVLGNHDLKEAFYEGFLGKKAQGRYYTKYELGGYRFLVLDTAEERNGYGSIPDEELDWLEQELSQPAENGTILLGHHPLKSQQAWFDTSFSPRLEQILSNSDVIAYLCGHAHYAETRTIFGIQQVTAESFAFGVETVSPTEVVYTETRGYNTCWLEDRSIIVHPHQVFPFHPQICRLTF